MKKKADQARELSKMALVWVVVRRMMKVESGRSRWGLRDVSVVVWGAGGLEVVRFCHCR